MDAKSSSDSSLTDEIGEGVIGEGSRSSSPTRNENFEGKGSEIVCLRFSGVIGISKEPDGSSSIACLNCAMNSCLVRRSAVGLSTLPVLSEVSLAVGSS
jgi:hypothetical protein